MSPQLAFRRPLLSTALAVAALVAAAPGALAASVPAATATPTPSPTTSSPAATVPAASAAYRSWGFYAQKNGTWAYAQTGPDGATPAEGTVDGWRFATSDMATPRLPRATPSFADICGKTPGEAGKKRVGVVVDYGRKADGPEGATPPAPMARCALVPSAATSAEVLAAVALPRDSKGMVCAIDNYPAGTECAPKVEMPEAAKAADDKVDITVAAAGDQARPAAPAAPAPADDGPSKTVLTGVAVVIVAVAGAGAYLLRRRQNA